MADTEVWDLGGPIAAPAAGDRSGWSTAPLTGGYSLRSDFVWKNSTGQYRIDTDGSVAAPSLTWGSDLDTGFYRYASGEIAIALNGAGRFRFADGGFVPLNAGAMVCGSSGAPWSQVWANELRQNGQKALDAAGGAFNGQLLGTYYTGSGPSNPAYAFNADSDTGMYMLNPNQIGFAAGGAGIMRINSFGILPNVDNTYSCGTTTGPYRFTQVCAVNGAIVTSDMREKTWRGAITEAEKRAALRIIAELGFYQWNDAIEAKGAANARYHFSARAQRVWDIMADEGLVDPLVDGKPGATPYAFLCFDKWDEEIEDVYEPVEIPAIVDEETGDNIESAHTEYQPTGETRVAVEAGDRFGLRPDQLALFLIAAQQAMINEHEARLAALEGAA